MMPSTTIPTCKSHPPTTEEMSPHGRILPLSERVTNQIAAGEVIERPASVVKELVENALDSGASEIVVELVEGGRDLIRVVDNGCGMPPEDLPWAIARHATSKLRTAEDLFQVGTFGFRGEALASIASVCEFELRSRPHDQPTGAAITVHAGQVGSIQEVGCPPGTQIEVRHLFTNLPVRRKFLKTRQTELGQATEALTRLALAHPQVGFQLLHGGRKVLDKKAGLDTRTAIEQLFGPAMAAALLPIRMERDGCRVTGFVAKPEYDRPNSRWQYLFVNGRSIRDRSLQHALTEAFRGLLMTGRAPVAFLFLDIPPEEVDVNVHPMKLEVRFRDPHRIFSLVLAAVRSTLHAQDLVANLKAPGPAPGDRTAADDADRRAWLNSQLEGLQRATPSLFEREAPRSAEDPTSPMVTRATASAAREPFPSMANKPPTLDGTPEPNSTASMGGGGATSMSPMSPGEMPALLGSSAEDSKSAVHPIPERAITDFPARSALQVHNQYIVAETPQGLLVVDQHALHERILYAEFRAKLLNGGIESQHLLIPEPIELPAGQAGMLLEAEESLARVGIQIGAFGDHAIVVQSAPALLPRSRLEDLLREIAEHLEESSQVPPADKLVEDILNRMACKAAVKSGDPLTPEEITALLARRHMVEDSHHCPHGRPTVLQFSLADLDKQFKRI